MFKHKHPFGGAFLPEELLAPIQNLKAEWEILKTQQSFLSELDCILKNYAGRQTPLTEVKNFARAIDGPRVFLKREDLLHTGAHKLNNALGQCLLAKYLGKTRVVAGNRCGTTWSSNSNSVCLSRIRLCSIHGSKRCGTTETKCRENALFRC